MPEALTPAQREKRGILTEDLQYRIRMCRKRGDHPPKKFHAWVDSMWKVEDPKAIEDVERELKKLPPAGIAPVELDWKAYKQFHREVLGYLVEINSYRVLKTGQTCPECQNYLAQLENITQEYKTPNAAFKALEAVGKEMKKAFEPPDDDIDDKGGNQ